MSPKEKAKQLISKYSPKLPFYTEKDNLNKSKECALICVDEILSSSFLEPQLKRHVGSVEPSPIHLEYWFEVKKEIKEI